MIEFDTVLRAGRVVTPQGVRPAAVAIRAGRILAVTDRDADLAAAADLRLRDDVALMPGLVDTHVHLQDPGHTSWEDFESGTRAAALGGVTTLVDMPLDSLPVTVDVAALDAKARAAAGRVHVDVGMWAGVTPTNLGQLHDLAQAGAFGFKCFLANTGLHEFPPISVDELKEALRVLDAFDGLLLVHAEDRIALESAPATAGRAYREFLRVRPASIEDIAVAQVIDAVAATGGRAHIVHVSSASAADMIHDAQRRGLRLTAETCPHYLTLSADDVPDGDTAFKVCPPIRDRANADRLWARLQDGTLSMVVSDHSPCAVEHKCLDTGDFDSAFGGVSSLQISLPVVWTEARRRGFSLTDVARWMSERPAELAGLSTKGSISEGKDADLFVLSPEQTFTVDAATLQHRQPITPYAGRTLSGVVTQTWLRGRRIDLEKPSGRVLLSAGDSRPAV